MKKMDTILLRVLGLLVGLTLITGSAAAQSSPDLNKTQVFTENLKYSQVRQNSNPQITLDLDKVPLKEALKRIADNAKAGLYYNSVLIPKKTVSLSFKAVPLNEALRKVLEGTSLRVLTSGRNISLVQKNEPDQTRLSQAHKLESITGTVTDAQSGETLPGVNILVKGTTTGASTNADGKYELTVESLQDTLRFSYVGYKSKEVAIDGRTTINVSLNIQAVSGEEMVVVGYGTQKKEDLTGSVSSVSSEELENSTLTTPDEALQGRVAGAEVHSNSHTPGGGMSVNIRGTASLTAGGTPLYVIDGVPISTDFQTGSYSYFGFGAHKNPLNSIGASDIASIQVLKDASATAIYGSRGANGVVLITTKKGKAGQQKIDFNTSVGVSQVSNKLDFINANQYAQQANQRASLLGQSPVFTSDQINNFGAGTDWQDEVFRKAIQQKYDLSFSGGTDKIRYLISGNYSDNEGTVRGSSFNRYGTRVNIDADLNDKFSAGGSISYNVTDNNSLPAGKGYGSQRSLINELIKAPPTIPARNETGALTNLADYPLGSDLESPRVMTDSYKEYINTNRFIGNAHGTYDLLDNLSAKVQIGGDVRNWRYHTYFPIGSANSAGANGKATQISEQTVNVVSNNTLTYQKNINNIHDFKILGGFTYQTQRDENLTASSYGFPSDYYEDNNLNVGSNPQSPGSGVNRWTLISYLGRLNYSLYDKYLLTASFRIDGDSKFGENNKYGTFPSLALAWRLGNEEFIKKLDLFSELKVRVGYGKTGNESIGTYQSLSRINTSFSENAGYVYNNTLQPIATVSGISNPDLSWEKTSEFNIGLDIGFFDNRVLISANYYNKKTTDLLLNVPIPNQTGFGSVLKNTGSMRNKGVEFQVNSQNIITDDFNWNTNFNISSNKNEITSLGGAPYLYTGWVGGANNSSHGSQVVRLEPGHEVGAFYGSVYEGVWHSQEEIDNVGTMPSASPGDIRYKDTNGDGTYSTEDDVFLGSGNPDFSFGLTNDFSYKQLNLHIFLYGKYGNKVLNFPAEKFIYSSTGTSTKRLERWTPDNPNSAIPFQRSGSMNRTNSKIVEDGSFIRIQNVSINYNLPVQKWHIGSLDNAKVGVGVDNLLVITNYTGYDPELNAYGNDNSVRGVDLYGYPASRTLRFNLKLGF